MADIAICPRYEAAIDILGKKWTGLLLRVLLTGPKRFCECRELVPGLSDRLLSQRLKELEEAGIVERVVVESKPVMIRYELTEKGKALDPAITALQEWAEVWC